MWAKRDEFDLNPSFQLSKSVGEGTISLEREIGGEIGLGPNQMFFPDD